MRSFGRVGAVESVSAGSIAVLVDPEAPHGLALGSGSPIRFPRVHGLVVIPIEEGSVVGLIHSVDVVEASFPKRPGLRDFGLLDLPFPSRRLGITPLGVLKLLGYTSKGQPNYQIDRGVLTPPSVGAPVLLPTEQELAIVAEGTTGGPRVHVGQAALSPDRAVRVDPDRFFGRHVAVLGNTGSGKSCTVAGLLRWSLEAAEKATDKRPNARFVVIDPNGEYEDCFSDLCDARVFKAEKTSNADRQLRVPAWLWNAKEWAAFSNASRGVQQPLLYQALRLLRASADIEATPERRLATLLAGYSSVVAGIVAQGPPAYSVFPGMKNVGTLLQAAENGLQEYVDALEQESEARTALERLLTAISETIDGHLEQNRFWVAFGEASLQQLLNLMRETRMVLPEIDLTQVVSEDAPIPFDVSDVISHLEVLAAGEGGGASQFAATVNLRIRTMLGHTRMRSVVGPSDEEESLEEWLDDFLSSNDGDMPSVSIVDLSMVPSSLMHVVASVVGRLVFESLQRFRRSTGEELPTVLVVEEAHHFVTRAHDYDSNATDGAALCRETFDVIAREGRKFGLGLVISSQRPSEVSPTLLSQCNTFLMHRIVNDRDQALVRRLVPDNLGRLLDDLPTLPTQHAILLGWAAAAPILVRIRDLAPIHRPQSRDPQFWDVWTGAREIDVDWRPVAEGWREGLL